MSVALPLVGKDQIEELFFTGGAIIDVRAPSEFAQGSIPHSVNLPLMQDEERSAVGTLYKQKGQAAAIELGHRLVTGAVKAERVSAWIEYVKDHPNAVLTCARGGLRSQIAQEWLAEAGSLRPRIEGGYKAARQASLNIIARFSKEQPLIVVAGPTGSGKTDLLRSLQGRRKIIDLEAAANHRGSAFGKQDSHQPRQADFENQLALEMLKSLRSEDTRPSLVEDESRLIGFVALPPPLFEALGEAKVVMVQESLSSRVERTFKEYVLQSGLSSHDASTRTQTKEYYFKALTRIAKKLGGLRASEAQTLMQRAWEEQIRSGSFDAHRGWVEYLLTHYYDPLYKNGLARRAPSILFSGTFQECQDYLAHSREISD